MRCDNRSARGIEERRRSVLPAQNGQQQARQNPHQHAYGEAPMHPIRRRAARMPALYPKADRTEIAVATTGSVHESMNNGDKRQACRDRIGDWRMTAVGIPTIHAASRQTDTAKLFPAAVDPDLCRRHLDNLRAAVFIQYCRLASEVAGKRLAVVAITDGTGSAARGDVAGDTLDGTAMALQDDIDHGGIFISTGHRIATRPADYTRIWP